MPEVTALREAISAPPAVFTGLAFSIPERLAIGFLAGLRGIGAVLPIIEGRRRDAVAAYNAARESRANKIRESELLLRAKEREREFLEGSFRFDQTDSQRQQQIDLSSEGLAQGMTIAKMNDATRRFGFKLSAETSREIATARIEAGKKSGRLTGISGTQQGRLQKHYDQKLRLENIKSILLEQNPHAKSIDDPNLDAPGSPFQFGVAITDLQLMFKAAWEKSTSEERRRLFGAAQTALELKNSASIFPGFGSRNKVIITAIREMVKANQSALQSELRTMGVSGFDVRGATLDALEMGFFPDGLKVLGRTFAGMTGLAENPSLGLSFGGDDITPGVNVDPVNEEWILDQGMHIEESR